jgi:hypothetical protein
MTRDAAAEGTVEDRDTVADAREPPLEERAGAAYERGAERDADTPAKEEVLLDDNDGADGPS